MMLTNLADAARKSGLPVVEVDGWRTRGHGGLVSVRTIVVHHTATAATAPGDYPSLGIVRDGRPDLDGPLAQLGLGRDGTVYVIAAGVAYHAGTVFESMQDNWHAIGIEAEHDGVSPWPLEQVDAYARLCAALCDRYGLGPDRVLGHKEVAAPAGRKTDPNFDMAAFRGRVSVHLANQGDPMSDYTTQIDAIQKDAAEAKANTERLLKIADRQNEKRNAQNKRVMDRLQRLIDVVNDGDRDHDTIVAELQAARAELAEQDA